MRVKKMPHCDLLSSRPSQWRSEINKARQITQRTEMPIVETDLQCCGRRRILLQRYFLGLPPGNAKVAESLIQQRAHMRKHLRSTLWIHSGKLLGPRAEAPQQRENCLRVLVSYPVQSPS